jgi:hypothetical protein
MGYNSSVGNHAQGRQQVRLMRLPAGAFRVRVSRGPAEEQGRSWPLCVRVVFSFNQHFFVCVVSFFVPFVILAFGERSELS